MHSWYAFAREHRCVTADPSQQSPVSGVKRKADAISGGLDNGISRTGVPDASQPVVPVFRPIAIVSGGADDSFNERYLKYFYCECFHLRLPRALCHTRP